MPSLTPKMYSWSGCAVLALLVSSTSGFTCAPLSASKRVRSPIIPNSVYQRSPRTPSSGTSARSSTVLSVWWFGGTPSGEPTSDSDESCELVAVRIERTSPNSRRIGGEIIVDCPIDDVWAILTDYDNLSTHVPNLVESRRMTPSYSSRSGEEGEQGDGSYTCRLYQKGSQKIVGFNFAASVTMDMAERIVSGNRIMGAPVSEDDPTTEERRISFKCVESQFFTEFDGEWTAHQSPLPDPITGLMSTTVSYVVDVRPKGPVPVAALEWRIREDVPTNLRAVKKAALSLGYEGVMNMRNGNYESEIARALVQAPKRGRAGQPTRVLVRSPIGRKGAAAVRKGRQLVGAATNVVTAAAANASVAAQQAQPQINLAPVRVNWSEDETMAAYLEE